MSDVRRTTIKARALASAMIDGVGLRMPVFRLREWLTSRQDRRRQASDGLAVPSPYLRTLVVGTPDLDWFLTSGRRDAEEFDSVLRRHGRGFFEASIVVEWGCGCGRLSRWIAPRATAFTGFDINARLVRWCVANLPGAYANNALAPPLPLAASSVEVLFACSVLTHLRAHTAEAWLIEIARILQPGGRALLTFHDPLHPGAAPIRERLAKESWVVRFDRLEGSNNMASFASPDRLAQLAGPGLTLVDYVASPDSTSGQAIAVFKAAE